MFEQEIYGRLHIFKSPILKRQYGLVHGFSSRLGGFSRPPYESLNLGLTSGDSLMDVRQNRMLFATTLGIAPERVVCGKQVHSTNIARVTKSDMSKGFLDVRTSLPETDGLVTDIRGIALMTLYADCVPVLFFEPKKRVIAVCHCGWRGTVGKLASKMAHVMEDEYECSLSELCVAVGPSISKAAYEVDTPVLDQFRNAFTFSDKLITMTDDSHGMLDLWEANRLQLLEAGLKEDNVEVSGLCTVQYKKSFFSHRGDGGKTGRNGAMIMML